VGDSLDRVKWQAFSGVDLFSKSPLRQSCGILPGEPLAQDLKELVTNGSFQPWVVPTALPLTILELREMGFETRPDHLPRMGIDHPVQHDGGCIDGRKGRGLYASLLEAHHVLPGLLVCSRIAGLNPQVLGHEVVRIERQDELSLRAEPLIGIGDLFRQAFQALSQAVIHALIAGRPEEVACDRIEGATANEDQRFHAVRVRCGVGEGKHRSPGVTHEGRARARKVRTHHFVQVRHVAADRERLAAAAALERLKDSKSL
jgi:hypothetical protein